jgi:hypothetical protein
MTIVTESILIESKSARDRTLKIFGENIMTESTNNETNRKKFPLEIILATSDLSNENDDGEFDNEEIYFSSENLPTLTIQYDGQGYNIVLGNELIKNAFNRAFESLGRDSVTIVTANVEIRPVGLSSNSRQMCQLLSFNKKQWAKGLTGVEKWIKRSVGTVHTFQGKEADSVILILGADDNSKGAAQWAASKPNLLNVAATRAKYRFYIVGSKRLWSQLKYFDTACQLFFDLKK